MRRCFTIRWSVAIIAMLLLVTPARAADELLQKSLPLRTALHHDPTLQSPLSQLVQMFRTANRLEELVRIYSNHVTQYPADANGRIVLARLLSSTNDSAAEATIRAAVKAFPKNAYLRFLLYGRLQSKHDPEAVAELDRAIDLETIPGRKSAWIDILLTRSVETGRRDLTEKHLAALAKLAETAESQLEVARKMNRHKLHQQALTLLTEDAIKAVPETMVAIQLEAAATEVLLKQPDAAEQRLARLLEKVTADYWRRPEIVTRRLTLVRSTEARQTMIAAARAELAKRPNDEAAVLDLAQILTGLQRRREALDVLLEAGERLPRSESIERQTLALLDRLHDSQKKEEFLAARLKQFPARQDLALDRVKLLYELGRSTDAQKLWDQLVLALDESAQAQQYLELARYLKRAGLARDAAQAFDEAVALKPTRLDVRRELAEAHLAAGNRQQMRRILTEPIPADATPENVLDLLQFMLREKLYLECRSVIRGQLEHDPEDFDLRMLLLDVTRRLADVRSGEEILGETRALADTTAKYRRWLEAGQQLYDDIDGGEAFLREELATLDAGEGQKTERRQQRRLAFAEVAGASELRDEVIAMLEADLVDNSAPESRRVLRQAIIRLSESQTTHTETLKKHLQALAAEDPAAQSETNARLAVLYAAQQRTDLVSPLLKKIDIQQINDPALLASLQKLFQQHGYQPQQMLQLAQRLAELNPTERNHWQMLLSQAMAARDEQQLRITIRKLLAGVDKLPLDKAVEDNLRRHLRDSYWRELNQMLASDTQLDQTQPIVLLEALELLLTDRWQAVWHGWLRAYVLRRLEYGTEAEEAVSHFERLVEQMQDVPIDERRVIFPDGLSLSLNNAKEVLLKESSARPRMVQTPVTDSGSFPPFEVQWGYKIRPGGAIASVVSAGDHHLLVAEGNGTVACLDRRNGKLVWLKESMAKCFPSQQYQSYARYGYSSGQMTHVPSFVTRDPLVFDDRFVIAGADSLSCYSLERGELIWRANVGDPKQARANGSSQIAASSLVVPLRYDDEDMILSYEPSSGTVTQVDPQTGKIVWERQYRGKNPTKQFIESSGASRQGDRLLIYGSRTAVIDLKSGEEVWSFEPWRASEYPITLQSRVPATRTALASPTSYSQPVPVQHAYISRSGYPYQGASGYINYFNQGVLSVPNGRATRFVPPAIAWAAQGNPGTTRRAILDADRLLLLGVGYTLSIDTRLPLAAKRLTTSGMWIGKSGRKVCLIQQGRIQLSDIRTGIVNSVDVQEVATSGNQRWCNTILSGNLLHATGPQGYVCVNALTGDKIFSSKKEDEKEKAAAAGTAAVAALSTTAQLRYRSPSFAPSFNQAPYNNSNIVASSVGTVADGVLYTLQQPHELVALGPVDQP